MLKLFYKKHLTIWYISDKIYIKVLRDRGAVFISSISYGSGGRFYGYTKGEIAEIVVWPHTMIGCIINSYVIVIKGFGGELSVLLQ